MCISACRNEVQATLKSFSKSIFYEESENFRITKLKYIYIWITNGASYKETFHPNKLVPFLETLRKAERQTANSIFGLRGESVVILSRRPKL
jgi:hypothetical protein